VASASPVGRRCPSVASTAPLGPTRRAAASVWPPAPAATSSTREPSWTPAQRLHGSAAVCYCSLVVSLYLPASNAMTAIAFSSLDRGDRDVSRSACESSPPPTRDRARNIDPRSGRISDGRMAVQPSGGSCDPRQPRLRRSPVFRAGENRTYVIKPRTSRRGRDIGHVRCSMTCSTLHAKVGVAALTQRLAPGEKGAKARGGARSKVSSWAGGP
jgi:hypothetical protein